MVTELLESIFPQCNNTDIIAFCTAWHFCLFLPWYQEEDIAVFTGIATVADIGSAWWDLEQVDVPVFSLSVLEFGTEAATQNQKTNGILLADYCHLCIWNKASYSAAMLSQMIHHLWQDSGVLGEWLPVPGHTRMLTLIYSLLKCCVLLLSSTAWSKHHCDLLVQTLAQDPESPKLVIQVNSVVEMQSELPWAMTAPSDSSEGFSKNAKHYWFFFFLISESFSYSQSYAMALITDLCKSLFVRMHITWRKPKRAIHFSHWSHHYWNTSKLATNLLQNSANYLFL